MLDGQRSEERSEREIKTWELEGTAEARRLSEDDRRYFHEEKRRVKDRSFMKHLHLRVQEGREPT